MLDLIPGRAHAAYPSITSNHLSQLKKQHLLHWIVHKQCARINWECVFGVDNIEKEDDDSY